MKKLISFISILVLILSLTACSGGNTSTDSADNGGDIEANQSNQESNVSLEGEWIHGVTLMTIEGDTVLVESFGEPHLGSVDKATQTITIKDGLEDDSYNVIGDAVFKYQFIKDKLVITQEGDEGINCFGYDKTFSFRPYEEETQSTEETGESAE